MKFELDDSLFCNASVSQRELVALFDLGRSLQHRVFLCNPDATSAAQCWIDSQSEGLKKELEDVLDDSLVMEALQPSTITWKVGMNNSPGSLSFSEARRLMNEPLRIHVEDAINDRAFLLSVLNPDDRKNLIELEENRDLEFVHGGGSVLSSQIGQLPASDSVNSKRVALFDSDALLPSRPSEKSSALLEACRLRGIHAHRLQRRAAENYLTKSQLYQWVMSPRFSHSKKSMVNDHFSCMTDLQRNHFRMRDGWEKDLNSDDYKKLKDDWDAFYISASCQAGWQTLKNGFGRSIRDLFADTKPQDKELVAEGISLEFSSFIHSIFSKL